MTGASFDDRGAVDPPASAVVDAVSRALAEDLLPLGDLTSSLVSSSSIATVAVVSRQDGVVAGRCCAMETFRQVDPVLQITWHLRDGSVVAPGSVVAEVTGPLRSILTAERTALNFLCHLSGVATLTSRFVESVCVAHRSTRVLDTRKTTPGLRALEKAAVRAGGGRNHRGNLSDAVLVKDNHLGGLSIAEAVGRARELWPGRMVEVECDRADQVEEAITAGATVVMLDNMTPEQVSECVGMVRSSRGTTLVEVSGGITLETAGVYAAAGADLVSVGALTHSAPAADISMSISAEPG